MIQLLRFLYFCVSLVFWCYNLFMDLQITKLHSLPLPCALAFYFYRFSFYVAISSVVILIFLFFCERPFARTISNRWPDHSLSFHYLYKYIYKNTADDMSAPWTRHRRYRFISFYGYSYVVQEFPFPAFASGFIASTEASSPMPS